MPEVERDTWSLTGTELQDVLFDWRHEIERRLQIQFAQLQNDVVCMLTERVHALEMKLETEVFDVGRTCKPKPWEQHQLQNVEKELHVRAYQLQPEGSFGAPPADISVVDSSVVTSGNVMIGAGTNALGAPRPSLLMRCWNCMAPGATLPSRTPTFSRESAKKKEQEEEDEEDVHRPGAQTVGERYSRLLDVDAAAHVSIDADDETEGLFDRLKSDVLHKVHVAAPSCYYNLFDSSVANLLAKRSKCPVWNAMFALKRSGDVEGVFTELDARACFARGSEWRGIMGETVFHICFLLMGDTPDGMQTHFGRLAQMIYNQNPDFVNMPYLPGFYEGEVALHLAIAHTDMGSVKWLLEKNADLEHYATGQFFHQFLWGEHPLAWAACGNKLDILEKLLEAGADCRFRDSKRNSVLHNMARSPSLHEGTNFASVLQVLKRHDAAIGEEFGSRNNDMRTPLQVAAAYEGGNVDAVLQCTSEISWVFGGVSCMKHPLIEWDSATNLLDRGREDLSALEVALLAGNANFFCVPVNQLMLEAKWKFFIRRTVMLKALHFCVFAVTSTAAFCVRNRFGVIVDITLRLCAFALGLELLVSNCCTIFRVTKTKFFRSCRSITSKALMLDLHKSFASMSVLISFSIEWWLKYHSSQDGLHNKVAGLLDDVLKPIALLVIWFCMAEVLFVYEYTCMILIIGKELFTVELPVYFFLQALMLCGFSAAIYATTAESHDSSPTRFTEFESFFDCVMLLAFVPLGGEVNVAELTLDDTFLFLLYFCYSSLSCILFLNLTISLFTERTLKIWSNSHPYYYAVLGFQCVVEEKRLRLQDLSDIRIGTKFGDGRHYLLVQQFPKSQGRKGD